MKTAAIAWAAVLAAMAPGKAWGASDGYFPMANPDALPVNWFAVLYAIVFVLAICAVSFKNSKRTHLD
ncbi:MAG: hypothetical protein ACE15C_15705 [Phycisphaerae bacterium]